MGVARVGPRRWRQSDENIEGFKMYELGRGRVRDGVAPFRRGVPGVAPQNFLTIFGQNPPF